MPFPETQRVIYAKNPLDRVICQFRFSPILKIDADIPAEFQDKVRGAFPSFSESSDLKITVPQHGQSDIPSELLRQVAQATGNRNYEFGSEDGSWKINLTRTFVAVTTQAYHRWEAFKENLTVPIDALLHVYAPPAFTRVGLRYVDIIRRSALGLSDVGWDALLQPHVTGVLATPRVKTMVKSLENRHEIQLSDGESRVRMIARLVESPDDGEICFSVDSDFYHTGRTTEAQAIDRLDFFNQRASRLIRWCITDRLHEAMEPESA